jgi:hypothetical protein
LQSALAQRVLSLLASLLLSSCSEYILHVLVPTSNDSIENPTVTPTTPPNETNDIDSFDKTVVLLGALFDVSTDVVRDMAVTVAVVGRTHKRLNAEISCTN